MNNDVSNTFELRIERNAGFSEAARAQKINLSI